jgi:hypothetical protein
MGRGSNLVVDYDEDFSGCAGELRMKLKIVEVTLHRGEVLSVVTVKSIIFWYVTPCSPVEVHRRFGGPYYVHLQNRRVNQARNHQQHLFSLYLSIFLT